MVAALPTVSPVTVSLDALPLESPASGGGVHNPFEAVALHEAESHELHRHHQPPTPPLPHQQSQPAPSHRPWPLHRGMGSGGSSAAADAVGGEDISDADLENDALAQQMADNILN